MNIRLLLLVSTLTVILANLIPTAWMLVKAMGRFFRYRMRRVEGFEASERNQIITKWKELEEAARRAYMESVSSGSGEEERQMLLSDIDRIKKQKAKELMDLEDRYPPNTSSTGPLASYLAGRSTGPAPPRTAPPRALKLFTPHQSLPRAPQQVTPRRSPPRGRRRGRF
jgi:hypothetical protein